VRLKDPFMTMASYADASVGQAEKPGSAATASRPMKPSTRLPIAIVKPKRKAEPPEANGSAAGQPAKKREAANGAEAVPRAVQEQAKEDSSEGAGLGGLAAYGSESD